jgi:glucoamylase
MHTTWIESPIQGRHGGPIRAGQWSFVVIGTHPVQVGQSVDLELIVNDQSYGSLPAYWLENKSGNSYWHVPVPPLGINSRIQYKAVSRTAEQDVISQTHILHAIVRPNSPRNLEQSPIVQQVPEALIGNRRTTARIDSRSVTHDIYFPSAALHSNVRPSEGDSPQSRTHFRAIAAGIAETGQIDWMGDPVWESRQSYEPGSAILKTVMSHREGLLRVFVTDLAVMAEPWPDSPTGPLVPSLYFKRYELRNDADHDRTFIFGLYVHAETNGGIGEPVLSWLDDDQALLASNAGHGHSNRKLARDCTVSFIVALDDLAETVCEPVGPMSTILTRQVLVPARSSNKVDVLIAGSFSNQQADNTNYAELLKPALDWFRQVDRDQMEHATLKAWQCLLANQAKLTAPGSKYDEILIRSSVAALLHCDADFGSVASGFDRGLNAYCRPREAILTAESFSRFGQIAIARKVFEWLESVRDQNPYYRFWFQKYSMDGLPEWETPSVDQTALIPWAIQRFVRRTGEINLYEALWPVVKQAADVMMGITKHPGLEWDEKLSLVRSAGMWDLRFGCHLFGNAAVVAGLRAAAMIAEQIGKETASVVHWKSRADRILNEGILSPFHPEGPGLIDPSLGHLRPARKLNRRVGHWFSASLADVDEPDHAEPGALGLCIPLGLLPADDDRLRNSLQALVADMNDPRNSANTYRTLRHDIQILTRLWMARYCLKLAHTTGDGGVLTQALGLLQDVIDQLAPLGLCLQSQGANQQDKKPSMLPGVWSLHLQYIEFMTELGGLDYDAIDKCLYLKPIMPWTIPSVGLRCNYPFGWFRYQITKEARQRFVMTLEWETTEPIALQADVVIPEINRVQSWQACGKPDTTSTLPNMIWQASRHAMIWKETLQTGHHRLIREWNNHSG